MYAHQKLMGLTVYQIISVRKSTDIYKTEITSNLRICQMLHQATQIYTKQYRTRNTALFNTVIYQKSIRKLRKDTVPQDTCNTTGIYI